MRNLIWKLLKACLVTSFLFAFVVFFYTTANTATEVASGSAGTIGPAETRTPEEVKEAEALRPPEPVGGEIPFRPTISEEEYKKAKEKATLEKGEEKTNRPPDVKEPGGPNAQPPSKVKK